MASRIMQSLEVKHRSCGAGPAAWRRRRGPDLNFAGITSSPGSDNRDVETGDSQHKPLSFLIAHHSNKFFQEFFKRHDSPEHGQLMQRDLANFQSLQNVLTSFLHALCIEQEGRSLKQISLSSKINILRTSNHHEVQIDQMRNGHFRN